MFCVVSRYVKSSLTVVVELKSKSSFVFRVVALLFWNIVIAVTEFAAVLRGCIRVETFIVTKKSVYLCCVILYSVPCKIVLFYIGAPCEELMPSRGNMVSVSDFKELLIDIVSSVISTMRERITLAEERIQFPFANRTNIYRCEDGRPICYCCLRVGHVAKYCWDRRYSCPHVSVVDSPPPANSFVGAPVDVQSLGRDVDSLLEDLHGIVHELEKPRKAVGIKGLHSTPEFLSEEGTEDYVETELLKSTSDAPWKKRVRNPLAERRTAELSLATNTTPDIIDFRDIT